MTGPAPSATGPLPVPALVLAADHRARGVMTIERYADLIRALEEALRTQRLEYEVIGGQSFSCM